jgi:hypothetical protein
MGKNPPAQDPDPGRRQRRPTRDGRSLSRLCTALVSSRTASTSSNGTTDVSSPRCPGANRPPATVTVRVIVVSAGGRTQCKGNTIHKILASLPDERERFEAVNNPPGQSARRDAPVDPRQREADRRLEGRHP